ncbi:DNA-binding transcriptional activator FucR [compost metagenome]
MRADRLLSILLLLQGHGRLTTRALAERLEVSERTIHRDLEALSGAGVPVVADRGPKGGWRLLDDYRTELTGLSGAEVLALFPPRPERVMRDLGLDKDAQAAATKLLAALPARHRAGAAFFRERVHIDTTAWREPGETVAAFGVLQEAVWRSRRLAVTYRRADGETVSRVLEPLGLIAKGATWYLAAGCDGEVRSYRAARVVEAVLLDEAFERPRDFDLAGFWAESAATFVSTLPEFRLVGRVSPELLPQLPHVGRYSRVERVEAPEADGWCRVQVRVQTEEEAIAYALGLAPRFELLEPPSLRPRIAEQAARAAVMYATP